MDNFQSKITALEEIVIKNSNNPEFMFREWFIKDHLMIVERLALELCDLYPKADRELVQVLVWFHDFGKPLDMNNEYKITKTEGVSVLRSVGFSEEFIGKVLECWEKMEQREKIDLSEESIEVQIISSADGASHFVGKFYATYFGDDKKESVASIEKRIKEKIIRAWERKIVLPEVKKAF